MRAWIAAALVVAFMAPTRVAAGDPATWPIDQLQPDRGEVVRVGDLLVHHTSGYVFPATIGDMSARRTTTYGDHDASVNYSRYGGGNGDAWIDVFVYPASGLLREEEKDTELAIAQRFDGRRIERPKIIEASPDGVSERWYEGEYGGIRAITGFRLSKVGEWFVKARVTIPLDGRTDALERAGKSLQVIDFNPRHLNQIGKSTTISKAA